MVDARPDEELLHEAALGDAGALEVLLLRHEATVRERIRGGIDKRWQSVLTEDDVLQETFIEAFLQIGRFEPRGLNSFVAWLTTMAQRNAIDAARELRAAKKGGTMNRVPIDAQPADASYVDLFEMLGGSKTSPSQAAYREEVRRAIDAALDLLPENYRLPICLYDLAGCSAEDVANACECSPGAMHMRRKRGHEMLQELLTGRSTY